MARRRLEATEDGERESGYAHMRKDAAGVWWFVEWCPDRYGHCGRYETVGDGTVRFDYRGDVFHRWRVSPAALAELQRRVPITPPDGAA